MTEKKKPLLIGLVGKAGSGKSAVAEILWKEHGFEDMAFADKLKSVMVEMGVKVNGSHLWSFSMLEQRKREEPEVRQLLQEFGTLIRKYDQDYWIRAVMRWIGGYVKHGKSVVISDVRYLDEAEAVRKAGGIIVRVASTEEGLEGEAGKHASETEQEAIVTDATIYNNKAMGLKHLERIVEVALAGIEEGL